MAESLELLQSRAGTCRGNLLAAANGYFYVVARMQEERRPAGLAEQVGAGELDHAALRQPLQALFVVALGGRGKTLIGAEPGSHLCKPVRHGN